MSSRCVEYGAAIKNACLANSVPVLAAGSRRASQMITEATQEQLVESTRSDRPVGVDDESTLKVNVAVF